MFLLMIYFILFLFLLKLFHLFYFIFSNIIGGYYMGTQLVRGVSHSLFMK